MKARPAVKSSLFAITTITVAGLLLPGMAQARPGELLPGIGTAGKVQVKVGKDTDQLANDTIVDSGDRTVVVGESRPGRYGLIARYQPDGSLDGSFSSDGYLPGFSSTWDQVDLQPDGSIVTAGSQGQSIAIARFDEDGSPDTSFNDNGFFWFEPERSQASPFTELPVSIEISALRVLSDGRVRIVGTYFSCEPPSPVNGGNLEGCPNVFELALAADGTPEPGFGAAGYKVLNITSIETGALILDDGSVVATEEKGDYYEFPADFSYGSASSIRFKPDGSLDPDYGSRLGLTRAYFAGPYEMARGPDGLLYAATGEGIVRMTDDGRPDPTFGQDGVAYPDLTRIVFTSQDLQIGDLAFDDQGRILISGGISSTYSSVDGSRAGSGFIARLAHSGMPDHSFGGAGLSRIWRKAPPDDYSFENQSDELMLQKAAETRIESRPDGSYVLAGTGRGEGGLRFTLAAVQGGEYTVPECHGKLADFVASEGDDTIRTNGGVIATLGGNDEIDSNYSSVCAGEGDDSITSKYSGTLEGGPGKDSIVGSSDPDQIFGGSGDDHLQGLGTNDRIEGGAGNDRILGQGGYDRISGGSGDDRISGGQLNDRLYGGRDRDEIKGGGGRDQLFGGPGLDDLDPGPLGPLVSIFKGDNGRVETKFVRYGRKIRMRSRFNTTCDSGDRDPAGAGFDFRVQKQLGDFSFTPDDEDSITRGGPILEGVDGTLQPGEVSGRLRFFEDWNVMLEEYNLPHEPVCWTGKSPENPWIKFNATLLPQEKQFAKQ
ncbi:MAG: hypothetical protein ACSLFI_11905 [Solirubrobacterales bacterium]